MAYHPLINNLLYAVSQVTVTVSNGKDTKSCGGTGFHVAKQDENGDEYFFFVSNRHVLDPASDDPDFAGYTKLVKVVIDRRELTEENGELKVNSEKIDLDSWEGPIFPDDDKDDVACLYALGSKTDPKAELVTIPYDMIADKEYINKHLVIGDQLLFIGYPNLYDHHNNMPIARPGFLACDPRLNYSYRSAFDGHQLAYEARSTSGASGSPVFAIRRGETLEIAHPSKVKYHEIMLVGINAANLQKKILSIIDEANNETSIYEHQNLSLFYKSDLIKGLIDKAYDTMKAKGWKINKKRL